MGSNALGAQPAAHLVCHGEGGRCAGGVLIAIWSVKLPDFRWREEFQPEIQCLAFTRGVSGV